MWEGLNSDVPGLKHGGRGPSTKWFRKLLETGKGKDSLLIAFRKEGSHDRHLDFRAVVTHF